MLTATHRFEEYAAEEILREASALARLWAEEVGAQRGGAAVPLPLEALDGSSGALLRWVVAFLHEDHEAAFEAASCAGQALTALAGQLRAAGAGSHDVLRLFAPLAQVLDGACARWASACPTPPPAAAAIRVAGRLNRAVLRMAETCVTAFGDGDRRGADAVKAFAQTLTHELNSALGAAESAAQLINEPGADPSEVRRFAGIVQRNARRARTLLEDVRRIAAEETGACRRLPLAQVVGQVLAESRSVLREAGLRLEIEERVPHLLVDAGRLEIVLLNLLSNAAKYSDPDRADRWVRIGFTQDDEGCWISVADNGVGIARDHQARIFERFFRAHPALAEGSGLGLAIAREAVRQMGGAVILESEPGYGSTFRVRVYPASPGQADAAE